MTALTDAVIEGERDEIYYWDTVKFLVEGCIFKVPRYQFIIGSSYFADKLRSTNLSDSANDETHVALEGVTALQLRVFLKLLFPIHTTSTTLQFTKEEWLVILELSTLWHFYEFRKLAKDHLEPQLNDPVERIVLGRASYISKWVSDGYENLVTRSECIKEEESERIGHLTTVRLYILRHERASVESVDSRFREEILKLEQMEKRHLTSEERLHAAEEARIARGKAREEQRIAQLLIALEKDEARRKAAEEEAKLAPTRAREAARRDKLRLDTLTAAPSPLPPMPEEITDKVHELEQEVARKEPKLKDRANEAMEETVFEEQPISTPKLEPKLEEPVVEEPVTEAKPEESVFEESGSEAKPGKPVIEDLMFDSKPEQPVVEPKPLTEVCVTEFNINESSKAEIQKLLVAGVDDPVPEIKMEDVAAESTQPAPDGVNNQYAEGTGTPAAEPEPQQDEESLKKRRKPKRKAKRLAEAMAAAAAEGLEADLEYSKPPKDSLPEQTLLASLLWPPPTSEAPSEDPIREFSSMNKPLFPPAAFPF